MKPKMKRSALNRLRNQAEHARERHPGVRKRSNLSFLTTVLIVFIFAMGVRTFIGGPTLVDGDSMYPTLINRERTYVDKTAYWFENPQRGDIIICYYPGYSISCVKRIVAVAGDIFEIRDGNIYVNDVILDESEYWNDYIKSPYPRVRIPEGCIFVMGDNRNISKDSRDESVGAIPLYRVVGKVEAVLWPISSVRDI